MSEEKITFKAKNRGGFDYTFNNLETLASVKMIWNETTTAIFKENGIAYIGMKECLDNGDIIELGTFKVLYRVVHHKKVDVKLGNIYQIVRIDKSTITAFDIDNTFPKQRVRIKNRKSFETIFKDFEIYNNDNE